MKVHEVTDLISEMENNLTNMKQVIENMDEKRGKIFIEWLKTQSTYLQWEENFNPSYLRSYRRGEIVLAHFGFNVGAEYGGMHYSVVSRNSAKRNPNLNVVPLSSLEANESEEDVHKDRVFLGKIPELNNKNAVAIPDQMRPISKIRVFKPRKQADSVFKLTTDQLNLIDDKIRRLYTKK